MADSANVRMNTSQSYREIKPAGVIGEAVRVVSERTCTLKQVR